MKNKKLVKLSSVVFSLMAFSSSLSLAQSLNCKEQYTTVLRLAAENTWFSKNEVVHRKAIAISYDQAGYKAGPGRLAQQDFLARLDQQSSREYTGLSQDQAQLREILKTSSKCFPGLSESDILNLSEMLNK
jgi:hypothetical protein